MTQPNLSSQNPTLKVYLGSTVLFIYTFSSMLLFAPLVIFCLLFSFETRYKIANYWVASVLWMTKQCCSLDYKIEGLDNLPKDQAYIVLSKHQSAWETLALRLILPPQTTLLKKSLTQIPFGGWALSTLKPIAIDRDNPKAALKMLISEGTKHLQEGLVVVIFPEGTRAAPNENKKFNAGGAILAQKSGYPVIPLAHNAGEFWPRYGFLKFSGTITVKIGPLIETQDKKAKEINLEAETWISQAMQDISL